MATKSFQIDGRTYQIDGVAWGTHPVWAFISRDGERLTSAGYAALDTENRRQLAEAVLAHAAEIDGQRASPMLKIDLRGTPLAN